MTVCLCGCGRPLKREGSKYATLACVPLASRQMGGRNSRRRFSLNRKARLFGEILKRLDAIQRPTRGDLLGCFAAAYERGYHNGYRCSDLKWARRSRTKAAA